MNENDKTKGTSTSSFILLSCIDIEAVSCEQARPTIRERKDQEIGLPGTLDGGLCSVDGLEGEVTDSGDGDHGGSETETRSRADGGTEKRHLVLVVCRWGCCWVVCWKDKRKKKKRREV